MNLRSELEGGVSSLLLVGFWSSQDDDGCLRTSDMDEDDATDEAGVASGVGSPWPWAAGMAGTGGAETEGKKR